MSLSPAPLAGSQPAIEPQVRIALPWTGYLAAAINAHGWKSLRPFEWDGTCLSWPQRTVAGVIPVRIEEHGAVLVLSSKASAAPLTIEAASAARRALCLDINFAPFHQLCRSYPDTAPIADAGLGPLLRAPTAFEDAIKTLLTTNVTWTLTKRMAAALCDQLGDPPGTFPTPEALARASPEDLRRAGLGYRAASIQAFATAVAGGEVNLDELESLPDPRPALRASRGFGPYAAAHLTMLFGRFDEIPFDSWALGLARRYLAGADADPLVARRAIADTFDRFGAWKALAFRLYPWGQAEPRDW